MQFFKLSTELITDKNISANELRVYIYLMSLYNQKSCCSFPSMDKIVEKLGMTKPTVNKSIKKLVELGYLSIEKQKARIGNYNKYTNFKHLVLDTSKNANSNENQNSTANKTEDEIPVEEKVEIEENTTEEVKFTNSVNASKIAKKFEGSKNFKISKWFLDRIAKIDETIVDMVLEEKPKTAKLFLIKCIEKSLLAGLELSNIIKNTLNFYSKKDIDYASAMNTEYSSEFYMTYANRQVGLI